jgi:hypothetical protein
VAWSKFHIQKPQTVGAILENVVARATWCPGFVYCSIKRNVLVWQVSLLDEYAKFVRS